MRVGRTAAVLFFILGLLLPGSALALSGTPVAISTPQKISNVAVAVDSSGTGYIVWGNTEDLPMNGGVDVIQYCVIPAGATACEHQGTIPLGPTLAPATGVDHVQVLVDGSTVVLLADVPDAPGNQGPDHTPIQEWQSTDGGNTWNPINDSISVALAKENTDYSSVNALIVPGTNELGYAMNDLGTAGFYAFPLNPPANWECSSADCNGDTTPETAPYPFATFTAAAGSPAASADNFASQTATNPGVMGVFDSSCSMNGSSFDGTDFVYGSGDESSTNDYNIPPGTADSAWQFSVTPLDCDVNNGVVAGGPSGFGVMERDEGTGTTVYNGFNQSTHSFAGNPLVTMDSAGTEAFGTMWQDAAGGIYAVWLGSQGSNPIRLAYSQDGGKTFTVNSIYADPQDNVSYVTSGVGTTGQGWAAWFAQGQLFVQQFDAADAVSPQPDTISTTQASGKTSGTSISIPAGTVGETDTATVSGVNGASATGTMAYALYDNSSCTGSAVFNQTTAVSGGKAAPATVGAALAPGAYYWKDTYGGDAANVANTSPCGSEKLTVGNAASSGGTATSTATTITLTITCGTTPCTVTITITITDASAADIARKHKRKTITLAKGTVTITKPGKRTVKLKLTGAGKAYLAKHHSVKATISLSTKTTHGTFKSSGSLRVKRR